MRGAILLVIAAALLLASPASAATSGRLGGQYRYWTVSNGNDLRDVLVFWATQRFHVQLEYWDFIDPDSEDQFRPEAGLVLRDRRKSVYRVQWRNEGHQERLWFGTDQILGGHLVGRAEVSPIVATDSTLIVAGLGADVYWRSWNFASLDVIRDPRLDGLWVVPMRVRLATESNDWIQLTVAPASRRTLGWAVDVKRHWVRLGLEHNSRFDFTRLDNTIVTAGFEIALPPRD